MTPVPRPEQGAATLRLTEEEREALRSAYPYIDVGDDRTGVELVVESILAARQSDKGLREAIEALADKWGIPTRDDNRGLIDVANDFAEAIGDSGAWRFVRDLRAVLARFPATPEPEATEVEEHECDTGHFDRTVCPEPCGTMHSFCSTCETRQDECAHTPTPARDEALRDRVAGALRENVYGLIADMGDLADALLGVLADNRAEAWDEGYDARGVDIANEGLTETTLTPNPYRKEATDG